MTLFWILDEGSLSKDNNTDESRGKPKSDDFLDDFVEDVAACNGPKVFKYVCIFILGN